MFKYCHPQDEWLNPSLRISFLRQPLQSHLIWLKITYLAPKSKPTPFNLQTGASSLKQGVDFAFTSCSSFADFVVGAATTHLLTCWGVRSWARVPRALLSGIILLLLTSLKTPGIHAPLCYVLRWLGITLGIRISVSLSHFRPFTWVAQPWGRPPQAR